MQPLKPNQNTNLGFKPQPQQTGMNPALTGTNTGLLNKYQNPVAPVSNAPVPLNSLMGQRAASPADNLSAPNQLLSQGQVKPPVQEQPKSDIQNQLDALKQTALGLQKSVVQQPTPQAPQGYGVNQGLYGQLITGLANAPQTNTDVAQARQNLQNLQNEYAQQTGNIEANRAGLSMQGGQEGILNRLFAAKQGAAQTALSSALTSQQLQQQALGQAAGLAAPQPYGITTTPFQPATGTFGTMPGGTSGAFGAGQIAENVNIGGQYQQASTAANVASGYEDTIKNYMVQNNLNPSNLTVANGVIQWLRGEVGDPKYQTLANYINEYSNNAATALGISGGNVTDFKLGIAQSLLNPKASAQSMSEVLTNNAKAIQDKLANMKSTATGGGQVAGGTPGYQPSQQGGNTFGGFFGK